MMVIAIIGILASVALPAYQNYIARAKIAEVLSLMNGAKTSIWEGYFGNSEMPLESEQIVTDLKIVLNSSEYNQGSSYTKLDADNAQIELIVDNISTQVNGKTIIIDLTAVAGSISVACSGGTLPSMYRPSRCR